VNPAVIGQQVVFTATVTTTAAGAGTPTGGTVTFTVDGNPQNPVNLTAGTATLNNSFTTLGSHNGHGDLQWRRRLQLRRQQPAGRVHDRNGQPGQQQYGGHSSVNPSAVGQSVTFTATVTAASPGGGTPNSGTVGFSIDSGGRSAGDINGSGQATFTTSTLSLGNHTVVAQYSGNTNYASSNGSVTQRVLGASTTTVSSSATVGRRPVGDLHCHRRLVAVGGPTPTGTVTFIVDSISQSPVPLSNGQATFTTSTLSVGVNHTIKANYNGDSGYAPASNSNTVNQTVNKDATSSTISANLMSSVFGQPVIFYAASWPFAPGSGTVTGTETVVIDGVSQGARPIPSGVNYVAYSISTMSVGQHKFTRCTAATATS